MYLVEKGIYTTVKILFLVYGRSKSCGKFYVQRTKTCWKMYSRHVPGTSKYTYIR